MKKYTTPLFALFLVILAVALSSCKPDTTDSLPPLLDVRFSDSSAISDTSTEAGQVIELLINGSNPGSNITYFAMIRNGVHVLDSGLNAPSFTSRRQIIRGTDSIEHYTIIIRDREFNEASFSFSIGLKPTLQYGQIRTMAHVVLGAQNHATMGSFLNIFSGQTFTLSEAFLAQDSMHMIYFYDVADLNTIASPNANIDTSYFGGSSGLAQWTIKNEIRYVQLFLSEQDFDQCQNDSLIIANLFPYETGKRKAKLLQAGHMYEFSFSGRYGIFYVHQVSGTDAGSIEISIKIQE